MSDRDPRRDPQPGDVLIDRNGQRHVVMPHGPHESVDLKEWRRAMWQARIVVRGREGKPTGRHI